MAAKLSLESSKALVSAWDNGRLSRNVVLDAVVYELAEGGIDESVVLPDSLKEEVLAEIEKFRELGPEYFPRHMPFTDEPSYREYCELARKYCKKLVALADRGELFSS